MSGGGRDWRSLYERERERAEAPEARDAPALQREVERLRGLLRDAGVCAEKRSTAMALRMDVERLRRKGRALEKALDARGAEVRSLRRACGEADTALRKALRVSRRRKETIGELEAGQGTARRGGADAAAADQTPRRPVGGASRVAEGEVRRRERKAGAAALEAAAGPAARGAGPRPHRAAAAR